jgi:hypothetical protein
VTAERDRYGSELPRRLHAVFTANPAMYDHRAQFPWVLACLGDPFAPVWFVAENPSLTQVERASNSTPEDQWNVSIGDKLFRQQLVAHGFKTGTTDSRGGWYCYITDVVKSVDRVTDWNNLPESERQRVAKVCAGACLGARAWPAEDRRLSRRERGPPPQPSARTRVDPGAAAPDEGRPLQLRSVTP